jgi:hypothetical protein
MSTKPAAIGRAWSSATTAPEHICDVNTENPRGTVESASTCTAAGHFLPSLAAHVDSRWVLATASVISDYIAVLDLTFSSGRADHGHR